MSHSSYELLSVICARCGHTFSSDIWLIVDTAECPDLLASICDDTLHDLVCPRCGNRIGQVDAPLLLYSPTGFRLNPLIAVPLLFSLAQEMTDQPSQEGLELRLRQHLEGEGQDEWLAAGVLTVQHADLPAFLKMDAEPSEPDPWRAEVSQPPQLRPETDASWGAVAVNEEAADLLGILQGEELQKLVQHQNHAQESPQLWREVIGGWETFLARADIAKNALLLAFGQGYLAEAHLNLYRLTGDDSRAFLSENLFLHASEWFSREAVPHEWAAIRLSLGDLYSRRYELSADDVHAGAAVAYYQAALEVLSPEVRPKEWAIAQHQLGDGYFHRYERTRADADARSAADHFFAALEVRGRSDFPW